MKNISDYNKLIAEFMGAVKSDFGDYMIFTVGNPQSVGKINHSDIKYDSSWDWLIPVFERIGEFKFEDGDNARLRTFADGMVRINRFQLYKEETLLLSAWKAAVDFIEWHNENKHKVLNTQAGGV